MNLNGRLNIRLQLSIAEYFEWRFWVIAGLIPFILFLQYSCQYHIFFIIIVNKTDFIWYNFLLFYSFYVVMLLCYYFVSFNCLLFCWFSQYLKWYCIITRFCNKIGTNYVRIINWIIFISLFYFSQYWKVLAIGWLYDTNIVLPTDWQKFCYYE